jgi:FHA domain-containing protein
MGQAMQPPLAAEFGNSGGTIGRDASCTLVLPDPYKHISRVQAEISQAHGIFVITDRGSSNPVLKDGQEIGRNRQAPIGDGDLLTIGDYEVEVAIVVTQNTAPTESIVNPPSVNTPAEIAEIPPTQFWNSVASIFNPNDDPFSGLLQGIAPASLPNKPSTATPVSNSLASSSAIPEDFDPFAIPLEPQDGRVEVLGRDTGRVGAPQSGLADPLGPLGGKNTIATSDSIDSLFDLKGASANPLGSDSALADPLSAPNTAGALDPLIALGQAVASSAAPLRDQVMEIHGSMRIPAARTPTIPSTPTAPTSFKSWENPEQPASSATISVAPTIAPIVSPKPTPIEAIVDAALGAHRSEFQPIPKTQPTQRIEAMNQAALQAASEAGLPTPQNKTDELLNALLAGLGMPALPRSPDQHAPPPTLNPDLMRRIGALLRVSTQGSLDLLAARSMLKKEMRSEVTMIVTQNNNPMKFSPDGIAALSQMLAPRPLRGFMEAVPAMQDSYNDLLAHQVGFVAGMRSAMQGLIERFDPASLESRLSGKTMLDSMLPMSRKARLWELFNELYKEISVEAEDDFEALFGRAFVKAYEEQIERLEAAQKEP